MLQELKGGEKLVKPDYPRSEIGHLFLIDRGKLMCFVLKLGDDRLN